MLQRIDLRTGLPRVLGDVLPRAAVDIGSATAVVAPLIEDVRADKVGGGRDSAWVRCADLVQAETGRGVGQQEIAVERV